MEMEWGKDKKTDKNVVNKKIKTQKLIRVKKATRNCFCSSYQRKMHWNQFWLNSRTDHKVFGKNNFFSPAFINLKLSLSNMKNFYSVQNSMLLRLVNKSLK